MSKKISNSDYEKALLGYLEQEFPPPFFDVRGTRGGVKYNIKGTKSGVGRQIDAAVYRRGSETPILIADAKNRGRKLDITVVDAFSSFLQDVECRVGLLVAPRPPTATVPQYAEICGIGIHVLTEQDALVARWLETCRALFPCDWAFHAEMARAIELISSGQSPQTVLEALDIVPFDEWDAFVRHALRRHRDEALVFLRFQLLHHYDHDWRAGALAWMLNDGLVSVADAWGYEENFHGHHGYYDVMHEFDPAGAQRGA